ncbi:hypothetical protein D9756_009278 [Leucocoprinus leucothites]|uniref:Response regulatory domain-containing protein n=1 Tax=Leucocoprinus leucothites TaxID=201217 RepID=A0A8H5CZ98_9AGAR|nr:hypothetical protein D9756_009278 [Leucoagaricus leucothites]
MTPDSTATPTFRQSVFDILKAFVPRVSAKTVDLTFEIESDIPDQLIVDFTALKHIITNLVEPMIDPTPSGGDIGLTCEAVGTGTEPVKEEITVQYEAFQPETDYHASPTATAMESTVARMKPFLKSRILFVGTLKDTTNLATRMRELGLKVQVVHSASEIMDQPQYRHVETIVVDPLTAVTSLDMSRSLQLRHTPVVLLAPKSSCLNVKWYIDHNISQITATLTTQDLVSALVVALESYSYPSFGTPLPLNILLAEDNFVNQRIFTRILEKCGHIVEAADNGSLAVDKYKERVAMGHCPFDIIFVSSIVSWPLLSARAKTFTAACPQMDAAMPIMDGVEATTLIRYFEKQQDIQPIPIIALILNGVVGNDLEKCLQAGMDDHVISTFLFRSPRSGPTQC